MMETRYLERLEATGVTPDRIDMVMCTHLHVDHVGWNTRLENGRWVPTFKNAKYVFSREDYDHYHRLDKDPKTGPVNGGSFRDSVLPVVEAGLAQMVSGASALDENLRVEPAPGHTPGTIAIKFESQGEKALFCGDILHHAVQVYNPQWNSFACLDADNARKSRLAALEPVAATWLPWIQSRWPGSIPGIAVSGCLRGVFRRAQISWVSRLVRSSLCKTQIEVVRTAMTAAAMAAADSQPPITRLLVVTAAARIALNARLRTAAGW